MQEERLQSIIMMYFLKFQFNVCRCLGYHLLLLHVVSITCAFQCTNTLCFHNPPFPVLYLLPFVSVTHAFYLDNGYTLFPVPELSITGVFRKHCKHDSIPAHGTPRRPK